MKRTLLFTVPFLLAAPAIAAVTIDQPFRGITHTTRTETTPRALNMHIVQIDLSDPAVHFKVSPAAGSRETVRQRTVDFLNQEDAQVAINTHFFLPFPSADTNVFLAGFSASNGNIVSSFDPQPIAAAQVDQSFAVVPFSPALNIDANNDVSIITPVIPSPATSSTNQINESVSIFNAVAGSAQIISNGTTSIPRYRDAANPDGLLTSGGAAPGGGPYTNANSWYNLARARTAIGVSQDGNTLTLFTVDAAGGSLGMTVGEVADLLRTDYGVWNALNLDGGGSTTLVLENPATGLGQLANVSGDGGLGRAVGSSLAVFAAPIPEPASLACLGGVLCILSRRRWA